jgi:hypothetical protein
MNYMSNKGILMMKYLMKCSGSIKILNKHLPMMMNNLALKVINNPLYKLQHLCPSLEKIKITLILPLLLLLLVTGEYVLILMQLCPTGI